jgi:prophage antirepressor-like protein
MEVVKAFTSNTSSHNITILGTHDNPLFRASEIGEILEIIKIRNTIIDFDDTEKVAQMMGTPGGNQNITFLTEKGLYKLLFRSRKEIAIQFQDWVCEILCFCKCYSETK